MYVTERVTNEVLMRLSYNVYSTNIQDLYLLKSIYIIYTMSYLFFLLKYKICKNQRTPECDTVVYYIYNHLPHVCLGCQKAFLDETLHSSEMWDSRRMTLHLHVKKHCGTKMLHLQLHLQKKLHPLWLLCDDTNPTCSC